LRKPFIAWLIFGVLQGSALTKFLMDNARSLDEIRRSTMWLRLSEMRAAGMLQRKDLADFSEELQEQVFYERFEQKG